MWHGMLLMCPVLVGVIWNSKLKLWCIVGNTCIYIYIFIRSSSNLCKWIGCKEQVYISNVFLIQNVSLIYNNSVYKYVSKCNSLKLQNLCLNKMKKKKTFLCWVWIFHSMFCVEYLNVYINMNNFLLLCICLKTWRSDNL